VLAAADQMGTGLDKQPTETSLFVPKYHSGNLPLQGKHTFASRYKYLIF